MSNNKIRVPLEISNYAGLERLYHTDKKQFVQLLKDVMELANEAVMNDYINDCDTYFKISFGEVVKQVSRAMFDYKGIAKQHDNKEEAEALEVLRHELNPLTIVTGGQIPRSANGEEVSLEDFTGQEFFDLKDWFQGLIYMSRFLSHKDITKYLLLGDYEMLQMEKSKHLKELIKIQPALKYQKKNNIPLGKRIEGTGFFNVHYGSDDPHCPACLSQNWNKEAYEDITFCEDCFAGVEKY